MAKTWFLKQDEQVFGPYGSAKLKEMALDGLISADSQIANSSDGPWGLASRIKGLQFAAAAPPPPKLNPTASPTKKQEAMPQLVELSAKKFKLMQIFGFVIGFGGFALWGISFLLFGIDFVTEFWIGYCLGWVFIIAGIIVWAFGQALAWWHHG